MNGFPTTNAFACSRAIHRTFRHYRINKLIFIQFVLHKETFINRNGISYLTDTDVVLFKVNLTFFIVDFENTFTLFSDGRGDLEEIRRNPQKHPIKYPKQNPLRLFSVNG